MSPPTRVAPTVAASAPPRRPVSTRTKLLLALLVLLALVGGAVYLAGYTGVLGVKNVAITGTRTLSAEQVRSAAAVPDGQPLLRVDTGGVAARIRTLPGVERVAVTRSWPGTVRITVTERRGVALVSRDGALWLVDPEGVVFQRLSTHPKLPILTMDVGPDSQTAAAALAAVTALSPALLSQVGEVTAPTPEQVTLVLTGRRTVLWGGAEDSAAKATVLAALLSRPGSHYDVSTPSVVTVR
ncbi:MAG TPA: FtsQ-type POTRA domain-containing protein [Mycobacteriales bacterium]|nr:FtsQ-type POTRA domain-containing protein [Mycobacteriales bacterium]